MTIAVVPHRTRRPSRGVVWGIGLPVLGLVLYGSAQLVRAADELQAARAELAELAIARERWPGRG